jgi:hypothetical protein
MNRTEKWTDIVQIDFADCLSCEQREPLGFGTIGMVGHTLSLLLFVWSPGPRCNRSNFWKAGDTICTEWKAYRYDMPYLYMQYAPTLYQSFSFFLNEEYPFISKNMHQPFNCACEKWRTHIITFNIYLQMTVIMSSH